MTQASVIAAVSAISLLPVAAPQVVAGDGTARLLEEITVTARKREEGLQDAPIAISAFTGDSLAYRGVTNIGQIAEFTPNLTFQNNPSFGGSSNAAAVYLRGVGQKEFLPTTEPGVGIYVDGVYIARSVGAIFDLIDIERVEVLRGPQGILFGRNTIGGAISLTTRKPTETLGGSASLTLGEDSRADFKGTVNLPLGDKLYSSLSLASFNRDGYVTREDGIDLGDDDTLTGRLALRWLPSDQLTLDLAVDMTRDRENGPAFTLADINFGNPVDPNTPPMVVINNVGANLAAGGPAVPCAVPGMAFNPAVPGCYDKRYIQGDDFNAGTAPAFSDMDLWGASLSAAWAISDGLELRSITAVRDLDSEFSRDGDHSPLLISQFFDSLEQQQFTQELQLLASSDRLNWILGLYYFEEDGDNINLLDFVVSSFRSGGRFDNEAKAVYGQLTYDLSDKLSATLGVRYTEEDKGFLPDQIIFDNPFQGSGDPQLDAPFLAAGERVLPFISKTVTVRETTPMVNLAYRLTGQLMAYASYSEGFKSGGFTQRVFPPLVAGFTAPAGTPDIDLIPTYEPEFVEVYELGLKYASSDRRLTINAAVFHTDYQDLQVQVFTSVAPVTENAASASIDGFELETQWVPGGGWVLNLGVGYLDAGYDELDEAVTLFPVHNDFERVSEWSWSGAASKEFSLKSGGAVVARMDWSYRSEFFNDSFNTPEIAQDAYSVLNASVAWSSADEAHRITFGATNLSGEEYLVTGVAGDAFQSREVIYARPTEWYLVYGFSF